MILADAALTAMAVEYAVTNVRQRDAGKLIRRQMLGVHETNYKDNASTRQFVEALTAYGLSLLDVRFGAKRLGDYLPEEALAYARQQHDAARTISTHARFVASVANACPDAAKPIREQITNERVEAIRQGVIETAPNKRVAEQVMAIA